ncbi:hypothetical protein JOQ06_006624 [Pogonophryne albipinna]|uniref:C-type lectin domain-containing protein n=1 Tax=Pogonophryne albipinna TaxID=1090488 RepID=A0AAD6B012_9TELE|nr:hypothetical protein JOQ06_006624 [Pogonophryne albipinna]
MHVQILIPKERNREETRMEAVLLIIIALSGLSAVSSHAERQYHFVSEAKTMSEAQRYCREKHTDLATVDSMEVVKLLNNMAGQYNQSAWIGLYDDRDSWRWSMSDPSFYGPGETEFRRWAPGEPSNWHYEQCTSIYSDGRWIDNPCYGRTWAVCFDVTALRDGNSGLINAQDLDRTETEGGNFTVGCSFHFRGGRKMFCKRKCEDKILVETTGDSAQSGRYSIRYVEGSYPARDTVLYVNITNLTKSDAGPYQCGLEDRSFPFPDSYQDFEIRVTDAPTSSKPEVTPRPFPTSAPSASPLTTTKSLSSVPSSASPERTTQPQQGQTVSDGPEPPMETEYVSDIETNQLYEEIREEDRGSSSPVETSTIYSYAKPNQPNGVESTDEYSLVTAATSQKEAKDDPGNLNYSEVDFSKRGAAPLHSAPCGYTDNVLYSDPRVAQSSDVSHAEDASLALYSTVSLHQM